MNEQKEIKFTCPNCGEDKLEEIIKYAIVSTPIKEISEDELFYCHPKIYEGAVDRYQCDHCGYVLRNSNGVIYDFDDLIEHLKNKMENK